MSINSGTAAREDPREANASCRKFMTALGRGSLDPKTVYFPGRGYLARFAEWAPGKTFCGKVGDVVLWHHRMAHMARTHQA